MKKIILLILSFYFVTPPYSYAKQHLIFAYPSEHTFPDYIGNAEKVYWPHPGLSVEFIKLLEDYLDVNIEFRRYPIKRIRFVKMKTGVIDGVFLTSYYETREEWGRFPKLNGKIDSNKRMMTLRYLFYKNRESRLSWDGSHLTGFKKSVAVPRGWSVTQFLKKRNIPVSEVKNNKTMFEMLLLNRVSAVATLEHNGDAVISANPQFKNIVKILPVMQKKHYYLVLSHQFVNKYPQLAQKIWAVMPQIRGSRKYQELITVYNNLSDKSPG